jgi:hypothetical protein
VLTQPASCLARNHRPAPERIWDSQKKRSRTCKKRHGSFAFKAAASAPSERKEELVGTAEKHVANQSSRLDAMMEALWEKVQAGDPKAIAAALAIEDRRSKLLGLDVAQRKALDITTGGEAVSFKIEIPIVDRIRGAEGEDA